MPTGTIVGLVGYLFYYALFSKGNASSTDESDGRRLPFHIDRLLMNGLLAAVLAHYVEIHFGIAISSTRMYFFLYVALMFLISYKLPREKEQERSDIPVKRKRKATQKNRSERTSGRWGPVLLWSFLLALIVGILGFEYTNYILPPGEAVATGADLSAADIFFQSLFINAQKGFLDSPFIYLMIVLTWALGCLIVLSEMVRQKELTFTLQGASSLLPWRRYLAAVGLGLLAFIGLAARFILQQKDSNPNTSGSAY